MLHRERQVALTYLTWRWVWLIIPVVAFFSLGGYISGLSSSDKSNLPMSTMFGLGMPNLMGLQWFVAVAKWQFVNPRARLVPNYAGSHLAVLTAIVIFLTIINPCLWALTNNCPLLGPLAFAALLGGTGLWAFQMNRGVAIAPAMLIFFSIMTEAGQNFWILEQHTPTLLMLVVVGIGLTLSWLWRIAHLDEEMEDYQVMALGAPGSLSRLENNEQKRMAGRIAARVGLVSTLSDRWHTQLTTTQKPLAAILPYGDSRIPPLLQALFVGVGCALYGIFLYGVLPFNGFNADTDSPFEVLFLPLTVATGFPGAVAGMLVMQRKSRMGQELLHPWSRQTYINDLGRSLLWRVLPLWLSLQLALGVVVLFMDLFPDGGLLITAIPYLIISFVLQFPACGLCLRMAHWRSPVAFMFGFYGVAILDMGVLAIWWQVRQVAGDMLVVLPMAGIFVAAGWASLRMARRSWLEAELG